MRVRVLLPEGSREKTIPLTTVLSSRPPPMTFTTRILSTLNAEGFLGMTCNTDLATSLLRKPSFPYCFDAIVVLMAFATSSSDLMSATLSTASSIVSLVGRARRLHLLELSVHDLDQVHILR